MLAAVSIGMDWKHQVFDLPVFQSSSFKAFQEEILQALAVARHPQDADMRRHLPAIAERMDNQQQEIGNVKRELGTLRNETNDRLDTFNQTMRTGFSSVLTKVGDKRSSKNSAKQLGFMTFNTGCSSTHTNTRWNCTTTKHNHCREPFAFHLRHSNATSMYNEWFGLGVFSNKPIEGGRDAAEHVHQTAWHRHFNAAESKQFSCRKIVFAAMQLIISGEDKEKVLEQSDCWFKEAGSLTALARLIQKK
jgi:hypothetical protein